MEQFGVPEGFNPSEDFESAHGEAWCQAIDAYMFWKSFPHDEDIFLEDAESCCCTFSSKFDDLTDEEDVDEGFAVHPMGKVKINMVVLRIICPVMMMMMCMPKCLECKSSRGFDGNVKRKNISTKTTIKTSR